MGDNPNPAEDLGYAFMQEACARSGAIWRRLAEKDIGLDGLIEFRRRDGTSAMLAVQVKSGPSYFRRLTPAGDIVLDLRERLATYNSYTLPVVLVLFEPRQRVGCWTHVQQFVAENPASLATGKIVVSTAHTFDESAFDELRRDARLLRCPSFSRHEIREFLETNRQIGFVAFVELVRNVLNATEFCCRTGIKEIEFLREKGFLTYKPNAKGGPGFWTPTERGRDYVLFMLGDRYFVPFMLMRPQAPVSEGDVAMCDNFAEYLANTRRRAPERHREGS